MLEPIPKLAWTKELSEYSEARLSAEKAMLLRIWTTTDEARAILRSAEMGSDPWLDRCLHGVRAGQIKENDSRLLEAIKHAQKMGKGAWFMGRLLAEFENAGKRIPGAQQFSQVRFKLVACWMRFAFWLMSDGVIAGILHVSREAIRKAVKELKLIKHPETEQAPIVKGMDTDGRFIFREGYPPKI